MGRAALVAMFALGGLALSPPADAVVCGAGVLRAGCVGPNGAAVVRRPVPVRDPLLLLAPVLFGAPPEYTGPDASAQTVPSCASDIREQRPFSRPRQGQFSIEDP